MRKRVFFGAAIACFALVSTVDARSYHRSGAHCTGGQMYRPSLGTCQSRTAFRRSMHKIATYSPRSRKIWRHSTRQDRRESVREARVIARVARETSPNRMLPTLPYFQKEYVEGESEVQAAELAMTSENSQTQAAQSPTRTTPMQGEFSAIPWAVSGPFSLNPLPRYAERHDLDWRR